jgi:hypothetical protein
MTVYVKDASKSVLSGLSKMKAAMIADYAKFMPPTKSDVTAKMNADKKFKKGDILMAAGWNAPARNAARGNILDGGYDINWTGACYL